MVTRSEKMRALRESKGLSIEEASRTVGLTPAGYFDMEAYDEEVEEVVPVRVSRAVAELLEIHPFDLWDLPCFFCVEHQPSDPRVVGPRNVLIAERRSAMGLSETDLGDLIGFDDNTVRKMESDPDFLDDWPIALVRELARALGVPPQVLVAVRCPRCGR